MEAVIKSLKGGAANVVRYMGPQLEVKGIICNLVTIYGRVESFIILMQ